MLRSLFVVAAVSLSLAAACAPAIQEAVALKPEAAAIEFAQSTPSANSYTMVGVITSDAAAKELPEAIDSAKNDLRNKAAALGATLVMVDETVPDKDFVRDRRIVHLKGRAFKVKE